MTKHAIRAVGGATRNEPANCGIELVDFAPADIIERLARR